MKTIIGLAATLLCLALAVAPSAHAAPSGLNVIPTADLLAHGEFAVEYENDGSHLFSPDCDQWVLLELGLSDRLEIGVDRCFDGERGTFGNLKLLLREEDEARPALAVGVQNLARGEESQPYLAVATAVTETRLHMGAIRLDDEIQAMVGVECSLAEPVTFVADHVTGPEGATGVGVWLDLTDTLSLAAARIFSPTEDWDDYWQLALSYCGAARF